MSLAMRVNMPTLSIQDECPSYRKDPLAVRSHNPQRRIRAMRSFNTFLGCKRHANRCRPLRTTAFIILIGFFLFIIGGIFAVLFPVTGMLTASLIWVSLLFLSLSIYACTQLYRYGMNSANLHPALANTIFTCLFTILYCLILYPLIWYRDLNTDSLSLQIEDQTEFQVPNVGIVQIMDRHDSPTLLDNALGTKAFVSDYDGGFDTYMPSCSDETLDVILGRHYCNCTDMWQQSLASSPLGDHVNGIKYRLFEPTSNLRVNSTTTTVVLQTPFVYNTTWVDHDPTVWQVPGPFFLTVLYDSSVPFMDALTQGHGSIVKAMSAGTTSLYINPAYRVGWRDNPYYYYDVRAGFTPIWEYKQASYLNPEPVYQMYSTLNIQFSSMTRTKMTRQKASSPDGVFVAVGGYFALVQFLSWILSGAALS